MGTDRPRQQMAAIGCWPTSRASGRSGSSAPSPRRSPGTRPPPRPGSSASWPPSTSPSSSAPGCWRPPPPTRPAAAPAPAAPKAYQPAATEVAISVPQRRYDALGEVLAQAIVAEGPASSARHTAQQLEQLTVATGTGESSHPA